MQNTYKELKRTGFLPQLQKGKFSMRLHVIGGQINSSHMKKIGEIAEKYGKGYVHLTSRQAVEIPFIDLNDIEIVKQELESVGLETASSGPGVRTVTACQGNSVCSSGLIETSQLAVEIDKRYFGKVLPHKFKIGITGCKNNCLKAEENDLGIKGAAIVEWNRENCNFCGACKNVCKANAIRINKSKKTLNLNTNKCVRCGKCAKICPKASWSSQNGYRVFFGGTFGNKLIYGEQFIPIITDKQTLFNVIDTTLEYFEEFAKLGERFRLTLTRNGDEVIKARLLKVIEGS